MTRTLRHAALLAALAPESMHLLRLVEFNWEVAVELEPVKEGRR